MKIVKSLFLWLSAFLFLTVGYGAVEIGKAAPDFSLVDIDGNSHSLSDYAGRHVVLEWVNYGCPYVSKHYDSGNMQSLQADAIDKGIVWLSICSSAPGKQGNMSASNWKKISKEKGAKGIILIDEAGDVGRSYRARATPHMFVINSDGLLAYNGAIDSIRSADASDIAHSENYVKAAYESLLAGRPVEKSLTKPYGCGVKY